MKTEESDLGVVLAIVGGLVIGGLGLAAAWWFTRDQKAPDNLRRLRAA